MLESKNKKTNTNNENTTDFVNISFFHFPCLFLHLSGWACWISRRSPFFTFFLLPPPCQNVNENDNKHANRNAKETVKRNVNEHVSQNVSREPNFRYTTRLQMKIHENDTEHVSREPKFRYTTILLRTWRKMWDKCTKSCRKHTHTYNEIEHPRKSLCREDPGAFVQKNF